MDISGYFMADGGDDPDVDPDFPDEE